MATTPGPISANIRNVLYVASFVFLVNQLAFVKLDANFVYSDSGLILA